MLLKVTLRKSVLWIMVSFHFLQVEQNTRQKLNCLLMWVISKS